MIVRKWNATWPVGFLIAVVILTIINLAMRAVSVRTEH